MSIHLKITNASEVVALKTSKWLENLTPDRMDQKLVEDAVIKGIIEQLQLEGIKGEICSIRGIDVVEKTLTTKNNFSVRSIKKF